MWASVRCILKTFPYSWLYYKGRACRKTSSLLRDKLYGTMGTLDLRPHTFSVASFPDDLWTPSNHFSWNTSLFPPQNYPSSSQAIAFFSPRWIKEHHMSFQKVCLAEMGHLFIWMPGTWFCQLYAVYKKLLLSAFPVPWRMRRNNFKLGKYFWEYCFIWEF